MKLNRYMLVNKLKKAKYKNSPDQKHTYLFTYILIQLQDCLINEIKALRILQNHPQILQLHSVYECCNYIYIVSEYLCGGDLYKRLQQLKHLSEQQAFQVIFQLLQAILYIHKNNIIHRDLKLDNILLLNNDQNDFQLKVADFGLCDFFKKNQKLYLKCGTPGYMAPEMFSSKGYNYKVDMFAIGIILFSIINGTPPFQGQNYKEIVEKTRQCKIHFKKPNWEKKSHSLIRFIQNLAEKDVEKRFNLSKALQSIWIQNCCSVYQSSISTYKYFNSQLLFKTGINTKSQIPFIQQQKSSILKFPSKKLNNESQANKGVYIQVNKIKKIGKIIHEEYDYNDEYNKQDLEACEKLSQNINKFKVQNIQMDQLSPSKNIDFSNKLIPKSQNIQLLIQKQISKNTSQKELGQINTIQGTIQGQNNFEQQIKNQKLNDDFNKSDSEKSIHTYKSQKSCTSYASYRMRSYIKKKSNVLNQSSSFDDSKSILNYGTNFKNQDLKSIFIKQQSCNQSDAESISLSIVSPLHRNNSRQRSQSANIQFLKHLNQKNFIDNNEQAQNDEFSFDSEARYLCSNEEEQIFFTTNQQISKFNSEQSIFQKNKNNPSQFKINSASKIDQKDKIVIQNIENAEQNIDLENVQNQKCFRKLQTIQEQNSIYSKNKIGSEVVGNSLLSLKQKDQQEKQLEQKNSQFKNNNCKNQQILDSNDLNDSHQIQYYINKLGKKNQKQKLPFGPKLIFNNIIN